jgi:hypothetical protein
MASPQSMIPNVDPRRAAYSTFGIALLVLVLITLVIAPSRVVLLFIPGSFLLACYMTGLLLERTMAPWSSAIPADLPTVTVAIRLGVGMSLLGIMTSTLGLLGLYRAAAFPVICAAGWSVVHLARVRPPWRLFTPTYWSLAGGLMIGVVWAITWLWLTIPPTFFDELAYHLPLAQHALRTGHLAAMPWSFFTYLPHLSDLLLGWGLALGGEVGARAMHFMFWAAIWIAAWALIEILVAPTRRASAGCLLAGAFASCGTFLFLGTLPFAETSLTFAVLASAVVLTTSSSLWVPLGLLGSLAVSVKLSGWSWVIAGSIAGLVMKWPAHALAKAALLTMITTLPWWGRAWWLTGNPVYPLGYRWIGGLYWTDASQVRLQGDLPSVADPVRLLTLLHIPYDMVMAPERFGSASDCGPVAVAATCLLLIVPLLTIFVPSNESTRRRCYAASLFVLFTGAVWVMSSVTTRFFAPALMLGLSTVVALLALLPKHTLALSLVGLSALGAFGTARFLSLHSQVFSAEKVALGAEAGTDFTRRTLDHYEAATYVRDNLPTNATLLFIGECRPFYFDRISVSPYPFHEHPLTTWIGETDSAEQLLDTMRREGFTHVILNTSEFRRLRDHYQVLSFTGPEAPRREQTLKQLPKTMTTLFSKQNVYVLEIPVSP